STFGQADPSFIDIPGDFSGALLDVDVYINITHASRGDLRARLTHFPTNKDLSLFSDIGGNGNNGNNMNVTLNDETVTDIAQGPCLQSNQACNGPFRPQFPAQLSLFDGIDPRGQWRLLITDSSTADTGFLIEWGLILTLADTDGDGVSDIEDECADDAAKSAAGLCGCGVSDNDADDDGTPDCSDHCADDAAKVIPGFCGCGVSDADDDGDGVPFCFDICDDADDAADSDEDGVPDCLDLCEGFDDGADADGDTVPDCFDVCPDADDFLDADGDNIRDCLEGLNNGVGELPGDDPSNGNGNGDGDPSQGESDGDPCGTTGGIASAAALMMLAGVALPRRRKISFSRSSRLSPRRASAPSAHSV
ncbi:MAG TPA: proprotein convertase P-domain-containing protein, partial [Phycisphaerae bacterium]|nr:proprotein convertase P-domain-containing protein [Phycisphaerae bacterium]